MVEQSEHRLDRVFHALSDPTRRAILRRLAIRPRTVSEISHPFDISLAAVSKHLNALEGAGLIVREARGRERLCRLRADAMTDAYDWLAYYERFWNERLDALERLINESNTEQKDGNT